MEITVDGKRLLFSLYVLFGCLYVCTEGALIGCSSDEVCAEYRYQVCEDTNGDNVPDTCLCQQLFYLSIGVCVRLDPGTKPCVTADPCYPRGTCLYDDIQRVMTCRCLPRFAGDRCQTEDEECGRGWYKNATSSGCEPCPLHTYKAEPGNHACSYCPSPEPGAQGITKKRGVSSQDKCLPAPQVDSFVPPYGPLAGGTLVNVTASNMSDLTIDGVSVATGTCTIVSHNVSANVTTFQCLTSRVPQVAQGPMILSVLDTHVTSSLKYSYREDPVITELDGIKTILKGGLTLTAIGQHMDSVYRPLLEVTRILHRDTRVFTSVCRVRTSSEMDCPTPDMTDGFQIYTLSGRRRRAASLQGALSDSGLRHRVRRDVAGHAFNSDETRFLIGFLLDGVDRYRNLSSILPEYSELIVYRDPLVETFKEKGGLYFYDRDVHRGYLHLKGYYLDFAAKPSDYRVTIGTEECNVTSLFSNGITCVAPPTEPKAETNSPGPHGTPQVTVHIGNLHYVVGYISYVRATPKEVIIGAIVGSVLAVLLVVAAGIFCVFYVRRRKMEHKVKNASLRTFATLNPNIYSENNYRSPGGHSASTNGYLQPISRRSRSDNSLAPLMIPTGVLQPGGSPATTPGSLALSAFTYLPDTHPPTPVTPLTPTMQQNVAYQLPRHSSIPFDVMDEINEDLRLIIDECRIESSRLSLQESIGKGFFGKVYRGLLSDDNGKNPTTVAIKTVQDNEGQQCTVKDVEAFLAEAVVMKDFNHVNVLSLLGVVIAGNRPYAVLPYMENGDLKTYISGPNRNIKVRELIEFGVQVAAGMEYLTNQKFVHRDLATRNCMINKALNVKIADFGLSRDIYRSDYYRVEDKHRPLPVKWMAIESLTGGVFSAKSDVWSFGVLMWELLTRGCSPYPDIDTFNLKHYLSSGRRLSQPEHAPDEVYAIMCSCWRERPDDRPTFTHLRAAFVKVVNRQADDVTHEYLKLI